MFCRPAGKRSVGCIFPHSCVILWKKDVSRMDAKEFGAFLAQVRRERNMTQAELAQQLHVTDKAVSRWERGIGLPDINTLEPLADALGLTLADLMHCHGSHQKRMTLLPFLWKIFFTMLRRQHTVDWHSVRTALLALSIALPCGEFLPVQADWLCTGRLSAMVRFRPTAGCPPWSFFHCLPDLNFYLLSSGTILSKLVTTGAGVR